MRGGECVSRQRNPFEKIQSQTNLSPSEIYKVADSVKNADFSDEKTVRQLVRQLAKIADKRIYKLKEDHLVVSVTQYKMPIDIESLTKMFKKYSNVGK